MIGSDGGGGDGGNGDDDGKGGDDGKVQMYSGLPYTSDISGKHGVIEITPLMKAMFPPLYA